MSSLETKNLELKLDDLAEQLNKKLEYQNRVEVQIYYFNDFSYWFNMIIYKFKMSDVTKKY